MFARLVLDGEGDVGVHNFIVPLRDPDTHEPLPGIRIGDLVRACICLSELLYDTRLRITCA